MQIVFLNQSLKLAHALTVSSNDEVDVFELRQDFWDDAYEEIDAFAIG